MELEAESVPGCGATTCHLSREHRSRRGLCDDRAVEERRSESGQVHGGREETTGRQTVAEIDRRSDPNSTVRHQLVERRCGARACVSKRGLGKMRGPENGTAKKRWERLARRSLERGTDYVVPVARVGEPGSRRSDQRVVLEDSERITNGRKVVGIHDLVRCLVVTNPAQVSRELPERDLASVRKRREIAADRVDERSRRLDCL